MKRISFLAVIWLLSVSAFAILPPGNVQTNFKKMYPKANGVAWSQDDGYYCANFVMNGFTKSVGFNAQAQWQAIIVIKVGQDNVDIKYQLFYSPQGRLLKTRNVSYMYDILGPGTFL